LCDLLEIKEGDIMRLYKQSLYWVLVSENPTYNVDFEKRLDNLKFDQNNLKYDVTNAKNIKKTILKKIQHYTYIKETDDLKASSPNNIRKDSLNGVRKDSFPRGEKISTCASNSVSSNPEPFSWRKKSDLSNTSKEE
jgi:hypothetical protein